MSGQQTIFTKREVTVPIRKDDQSFDERQKSIWEEMSEQMERRKQEWEAEVSDLKKDFIRPMAEGEGVCGNGGLTEAPPGRDKMLNKMFYDKGDSEKVFRVCFNVGQFNQDEVNVTAVDGKLVVQARHEEIHDGNTTSREFSRKVDLPSGVDPQSLRSTISKDGILQVEADVSNEVYASNISNDKNKSSDSRTSPHSFISSLSSQPPSAQHQAVTTYVDPRDGSKIFKVTVDMGPEFQPEDLQVKSVARKLIVRARHEEKVEGRTSSKEFNREFDLPDDVDPNKISANMSGDGRLVLEAPFSRR